MTAIKLLGTCPTRIMKDAVKAKKIKKDCLCPFNKHNVA